MRIGGALTKWNKDRGFGFITPAQGGSDIFVHISEFPRDGKLPTLGEKLTFEVITDNKGKQRAVNLLCPQRQIANTVSAPTQPPKQGIFKRLIPLAVVLLGIYGYNGYRSHTDAPSGAIAQAEPQRDGDSSPATDLPPEAHTTLRLIKQGGPFPYERDGVVFGNYERRLPDQPRGYYHEYTVPTPGERTRGARRIVCGGEPPPGTCYYTSDHYNSFRRIQQ